MKIVSLITISLVCCAAMPAVAQASLVGDKVSATELYPDTATSLGTTGPFTIASGGTDFGTVGMSAVDVVVGGATISLDAVYPYTPLVAMFDGFDIKDLNAATTITGVSLASGTLPAGDLSFGAHDVFINLSGVPLDPGAPIVLDITSSVSQAVPEPATWAMMFLGFGMVGYNLRARRQKVNVNYAG